MRNRRDVLSGRQGYHIILSFSDEDQKKISSEMAMKIISEFARRYIPDYEAVYSVHDDTDHKHCHLIWNSVNMITGKKYHYDDGDWARYIQPIVNELTSEFGLDTINVEEWAESENMDYSTWQKKKDGMPIWSDFEKHDIDQAIEEVRQQGGSYEDFLQVLRDMGYELNRTTAKTLTLKHPGKEQGRRSSQLGKGYYVDHIKARLAGMDITELPEEEETHKRANKNRVSPVAAPAAVSPALPVVSAVRKRSTPQVYTMIRYQYGIKMYRARRAFQPMVRPAAGILDIRKISWRNRKYAVDLQRIASDYAWMVHNDVSSAKKAEAMSDRLASEKKRLTSMKRKAGLKKKQLLEEREQLLENLFGAEGENQRAILDRIRQIDQEVSVIDLQELPAVRRQLEQNREEIKRADRVQQEIQAITEKREERKHAARK